MPIFNHFGISNLYFSTENKKMYISFTLTTALFLWTVLTQLRRVFVKKKWTWETGFREQQLKEVKCCHINLKPFCVTNFHTLVLSFALNFLTQYGKYWWIKIWKTILYINYNSETRSDIMYTMHILVPNFAIGHHSTNICTSLPAFHIYPPEKR